MKAIKEFWESISNYLQSKTLYRGIKLGDLLVKLFYIATLTLVIIWMMPSERGFQYSNLTVNSISPEEIIAPFKFAIQKTEAELEAERKRAQEAIPRVYDKKPGVENRQIITLNKFFDEIQTFFNPQDLAAQEAQVEDSVKLLDPVLADSFLIPFNVKYNVRLDRNDLQQLYVISQHNQLGKLEKQLEKGLRAAYKLGIINHPKAEIVETEIVIIEDNVEETIPLNEVMAISDAKGVVDSLLKDQNTGETLNSQIADFLTFAFLTPNLIFNEPQTKERKDKAVHEVPLTRGYVEQNERIIDSNEKVTREIYQKLVSLEIALNERSATTRGWDQLKLFTGRMLFAIILIMIMVFYVYFYRRSIFKDNRFLGMIMLIFLIQLGFAAIILNFTEWSNLTIPIIIAPMLIAVLLDFGIAFICLVTLSLIIGSILGNDYTFTFMSLIVGSIAIFSVQRIRNRRHMFRAIVYILLAYLVVNLILGLILVKPFQEIFRDFAYYLLPNAILAPVIIFFLIGIFERIFDVTTDITLLELSDLNHPLMKRLSVKAPGSFHHSVVVANLAEAAAVSIGANALLTRVGCYFHDIGKMLKPEYFVENQHGGVNKHDSLSPHMSYLIIVNHVKEGVKLAEKYKLPNAVKQFIPEHHGNSLVSYFYHKAKENNDGKEINESDFRYPGPRPQTKETAIAMMADTVEAASRALKDPSPQRIRTLVDSLIESKLKEDQLDECDLTLKDIYRIKEAFIPILTGIHHLRIEYPDENGKKKDKKPAEEKTDLQLKENHRQNSPQPENKKQPVEVSDKDSHAESS